MNKLTKSLCALLTAGTIAGCASKEVKLVVIQPQPSIDERLSRLTGELVSELKDYAANVNIGFLGYYSSADAQVGGYGVTLQRTPPKAEYDVTSIDMTTPDGLRIRDLSGTVKGKPCKFGVFDSEQDGISGKVPRSYFSKEGEEIKVAVNPAGQFAKELYEQNLCTLLNDLRTRRSEVTSHSKKVNDQIAKMRRSMAELSAISGRSYFLPF